MTGGRGGIFDPIRLAIELFLETKKEALEEARSMVAKETKGEKTIRKEEIEERARKRVERELGPKLRTRAREMPELVESIGLVPALSFYYAKAKDKREESIAYRLYLRAILRYLTEGLGVLDLSIDDALNSPAETLEKLYPLSSVAASLLRPFLVEFKRLCEASWKAERGE